jgi:hypothetical protein
MSFFIPNGPTIPGSANLDSATIKGTNISNITNQGDINIITTNGSVKLIIGTTIYIWPTSPPPNYNYVLGVINIQTVDDITTYTLGWTFGFVCFHASTKVTLEDQTVVTMDKLKYGDKVLATDKNMNFVYSPVVDFTGVFPNKPGSYVKIFNKHGTTLMVSGTHLIYANNEFMMANDLKIGMKLLMNKNGVPEISEISHLENGFAIGWYTPLTKTGTIVAEGIVASCHTSGKHNMVRFMYMPLYVYLYFRPNVQGKLPIETEHWFSIKYRRGPIGKCVENVLKKFNWT